MTSNINREGMFFNTSDELVTTNNNQSSNLNLKKYGNLKLNYYQKLQKKGRSFSVGFHTVFNNYQRNNNQNTFITRNINTDSPFKTNFEILKDEDINSSNICKI